MTEAYADMSPEQLAADPDFQAYVLEGRETAAWQTRLATDLALAARASEARRLIERTREVARAGGGLLAAADRTWARIAASTGIERAGDANPAPVRAPEVKVVTLGAHPAARRARTRRLVGIALAAAAALLALLLFLPDEALRYETGAGETLVVDLPDGSRATLAPASRLTVDDYNDARALTLTGEAFFEVERGAAFTVATAEGRVTVLGTSFAVATFDGLDVACATGRVRVSTAVDTALLTSGLAASATVDSRLTTAALPVADIGTWRDGRLTFRNEPLASVAAELGRFYDREIALGPDMAARRITIELPIDDLATAAARLGFVLQAQVDTSAGGLRIR